MDLITNLSLGFGVAFTPINLMYALIGCILGAVVSGIISDKFGRKWPLLLSAFLFTVASLGTGFASTYVIFVVFRIVGGVGIGLASALSPMYIAEVAPSHLRGRFVSLNQMTLVIGILAAQIRFGKRI